MLKTLTQKFVQQKNVMESKISSEWAEPCPYKGIAAGCCQNGSGGLLGKLTVYNKPEQGSKHLFTSNRLKIYAFRPLINFRDLSQ